MVVHVLCAAERAQRTLVNIRPLRHIATSGLRIAKIPMHALLRCRGDNRSMRASIYVPTLNLAAMDAVSPGTPHVGNSEQQPQAVQLLKGCFEQCPANVEVVRNYVISLMKTGDRGKWHTSAPVPFRPSSKGTKYRHHQPSTLSALKD